MPVTVWVLMFTQALSMSAAPLIVFSGGIVGGDLAPVAGWATLPIALVMVGTAASVIPVTRMMHRWGRRSVFVLGALLAGGSSVIAAMAISAASFWWFCVAGFLMGGSVAIAQQYRFAAIEAVSSGDSGKAASRVLLGGLIAAYIGPELVVYGRNLGPIVGLTADNPEHLPFIGAFLLLGAVCLLAMLVLLVGYRNQSVVEVTAFGEGRPLGQIFRHPLIWLAIVASAMGYAMMSFMMTATPVNMHKIIGHSLMDTKWVIQSHIMAMFLPSFFSGWLISRIGHHRMIAAGVLAYVVCLAVAYSGHHLMHYWWALVLLGVGWNFLFVGGTALLPLCYQPAERYKVQSVNEFIVFGIQATAALSSGWVVNQYGWDTLLGLSSVMVMLVVLVLWVNRRSRSEFNPVTG
ncbi:MFS transporter [Hahella sp. CCB-MM4]|uniref:MFS transporter n=1 Tax=Hahella sp. (strain CCB-MM4) TaxID=1926491 RepID=UPI000B9B5D70|nr:MFS transporter [Hahella sp. CCB-MM4]OZG72512.1 MFS transporter [Hahella sp. CCB-MM4]